MAGGLSMASAGGFRGGWRRTERVGEFGAIGGGLQLRNVPVVLPPSPIRRASGAARLRRPCGEARALTPAQEWVGLPHWRTKPMNELRVWGIRDVPTSARNEWEAIAAVAAKDPTARHVLQLHQENLQHAEGRIHALQFDQEGASLAEWGAIVLATADPVEKAVLTHHAYRLWCCGHLPLGVAQAPDSPARPAKPQLVTNFAPISHSDSLCICCPKPAC